MKRRNKIAHFLHTSGQSRFCSAVAFTPSSTNCPSLSVNAGERGQVPIFPIVAETSIDVFAALFSPTTPIVLQSSEGRMRGTKEKSMIERFR